MSALSKYPRLNFMTGTALLLGAVRSQQNVLLLGNPGIGKSALATSLETLQDRPDPLPVRVIIASTCDPTDFGGLPVVAGDSDSFSRIPMAAIREAADRAVILFLDEITTAAPAIQAACLRLLTERVAGDVALHPETVIIAAGNPPEQAPGGFDLCAPMVGRFGIWNFDPELDEFRAYFERIGPPGSELRAWGEDFSATTTHEPGLLETTPPDAAVRDGAQWAAPRNWERAFRLLSAMPGASDAMQIVVLSGCVGQNAAASYLGIRKLRAHLPSVDAIVADPTSAPVPESPEYQIGALGLLANVAGQDTGAAWLYAARLRPEIRNACAASLKRRPFQKTTHTAKGRRAMAEIIGKIGRGMA